MVVENQVLSVVVFHHIETIANWEKCDESDVLLSNMFLGVEYLVSLYFVWSKDVLRVQIKYDESIALFLSKISEAEHHVSLYFMF